MGGAAANVAVTLRATVMLTRQLPVPLQAPLQPVKVEPAEAVAVNVTDVPDTKDAVQVAPQAIPAGADNTVPDPVPVFVTVTGEDVGGGEGGGLPPPIGVLISAWISLPFRA